MNISKRTETLKEYLIVRLFAVMFFILLSEGLVNLLISHGIFPMLRDGFGVEFLADGLSGSEQAFILLKIFLYLAGELLYNAMGNMFPAPLVVLVREVLSYPELENVVHIPDRSSGLLLMTVIAALILYVIPYVVGIVVYSFIVAHKVEEIRKYDKEQREQFTKKRNLLLSDIAHDLKTPITTISGYAQALSDGMVETPEKQQEYLHTIQAKSMQMNRLINVLFDYVKLDSEGFELKTEKVNLSEFLREISAEMYTDIEEAGMELAVQLPLGKYEVMADKSQLARAVINLLSNAVKHNPKGTLIQVSLAGCQTLRIADTGNKIDESLAEHLFEPFVMGDESRSSRAGSGLGLSIAAKIAEMHGGKLRLEQPAEKPYTKAFYMELPKMKEKADEYEYE